MNLQFTSIRRLLQFPVSVCMRFHNLQFTSIRRLLLGHSVFAVCRQPCSSHPSADCYARLQQTDMSLWDLQFTSIRRLLQKNRNRICIRQILQFTSIRRLLRGLHSFTQLGNPCSSHPSADCYPRGAIPVRVPRACSSHPSADCYCNILCSASVPNTIYRATR